MPTATYSGSLLLVWAACSWRCTCSGSGVGFSVGSGVAVGSRVGMGVASAWAAVGSFRVAFVVGCGMAAGR